MVSESGCSTQFNRFPQFNRFHTRTTISAIVLNCDQFFLYCTYDQETKTNELSFAGLAND